MELLTCPKCQNNHIIKSGIINSKQRYLCKKCNYFFTVNKIGKKIDDYYVTKALQLYLEGLSFREIERIIGVSHVTVSNWVKTFNIKKPSHANYHPTYKIFSHLELVEYLKNQGKRVEVLAFGKTTSSRLKEAADEFIDLDSDTNKFLLKK
mgnify:CR=1 FL=1